MITGIYEFGFFGPNMAVSWRTSAFQKKELAETPNFIVFFGCALLGQGVKKGKFENTPKKEKWLITGSSFCFSVFLCSFVASFTGP